MSVGSLPQCCGAVITIRPGEEVHRFNLLNQQMRGAAHGAFATETAEHIPRERGVAGPGDSCGRVRDNRVPIELLSRHGRGLALRMFGIHPFRPSVTRFALPKGQKVLDASTGQHIG